MDLVPKPDQVVSAAGNVAQKVLYGGLADLRPMPRTLIDEGELREVYHYRPSAQAREHGDPVLLVTPLAAPSLCYDLRRGCSVVEELVANGRPTYLLEYGQVSFRDRNLGMEHWVDEVVPKAIETVSEHAGGRPVHVVGWSLGGIFAMLVAADRADLPIASLVLLGSPVDVSQVPLVAPLRPLINLTDGRLLTPVYRALGGAPRPLVRAAFQFSAIQKLLTKPLAVATRLDDTDFLAQVEAVDRFTDNMIAYPGRTFGQLYHRFVKGNALVDGTMELDGRDISLSDIAVPVLVFAGSTDGIAPVNAVRAVVPLLSGSPEVSFEIVPGGHLGMLTGRAARGSTWRVLEEWIEDHAETVEPTPLALRHAGASPREIAAVRSAGSGGDTAPAPRKAAAPGTRTTLKAPAKKATAKKASAKKASATKASAKKAPAATKTTATKASATKSSTTKAAAKKTAGKKTAGKKTAGKKTAAKAAGKKSPTRNTAGKKTATRKSATKDATGTGSSPAIGSNPERRYGSAGSRGLAR